ncbi:MAG: hypothetical protein ACYC1D_03515 [Acidimicrobiales bacterium]
MRSALKEEATVERLRRDLDPLVSLGGEAGGDAAKIERIGATLLAMGEVPDIGPDLAGAALESLERAGDAPAAGVLAAMAVLARPPLAGQAGAALERLHRAGVHSPVEEAVGTLRVEEVRRLEIGPGELLAVLMRRPGDAQVQAAMVIVEHDETGGAAIGGSLSPSGPGASLGAVLRKLSGHKGHRLSPGELTELLRSAVARTAGAGLAVTLDLAAVLPILARALTGDPAAFARLTVDGGHELPLDPEDDEEFEAASEELADHLGAVYDDDPVVARSGPFVATTMLDYKWNYGDRRLGSWTTTDLDEYLLDYFPRKVSADQETVLDTPSCVVAFLSMLHDHGALAGSSMESLGAHVEAVGASFHRAAEDRRRWGFAKTMMMAMLDDGVDPDDPDAVEDWIDAFNARSRL